MSETFTLTGKGNYLSSNYYPSIVLDAKYTYKLGLIGLYTFNAVQNIFEGNNKIYWRETDGTLKHITIPSGAYEIVALNDYINRALTENPKDSVFSLKANSNTLKCELKSKYYIDFTPADSIGRMLGFSQQILVPSKLHNSDLPVKIAPATNIRVECNLTGGAYLNEAPAHTLYEFALDVEPGEQVKETPTNILYLPVITDQIDNITLKLTDQNGRLINFGEEEVTVRLELKRFSNNGYQLS